MTTITKPPGMGTARPPTSASACSSIMTGKDRYGSKGPFYNGGAAWDGSVALAVDGGMASDFYDLPASTGLGMGDLGGWGLFIEEGGADQYAVSRGLGHGADDQHRRIFRS